MKIDPKYKAVGFDMDGTLLDTNIDYFKLGNAEYDVLVSLGVPPEKINTHDNEHDLIIHGIEYLRSIGREYDFSEISALINKRSEEIELESVDTAEVSKGAEELLIALKERGYPIGLLTRGQRNYALEAMSKCGLLQYMDVIEAYDDHPTGEQKPNPIAMTYLAKRLGVKENEILYIGDSVWDYYCARDAGSGFIGIANGEKGRLKWEQHKEKVTLIESLDEIEIQ